MKKIVPDKSGRLNLRRLHTISSREILTKTRTRIDSRTIGRPTVTAPNGGTHRISAQDGINPTISIVQ